MHRLLPHNPQYRDHQELISPRALHVIKLHVLPRKRNSTKACLERLCNTYTSLSCATRTLSFHHSTPSSIEIISISFLRKSRHQDHQELISPCAKLMSRKIFNNAFRERLCNTYTFLSSFHSIINFAIILISFLTRKPRH